MGVDFTAFQTFVTGAGKTVSSPEAKKFVEDNKPTVEELDKFEAEIKKETDNEKREKLIKALNALKLANQKPPKPPESLSFDGDGGTKFDVSKDKDNLINEPFKLSDEKEDKLWRAERLKLKGATVVIDKNAGLEAVKKALNGKDLEKDTDSAVTELVKNLWENEDGIKDESGTFHKRRIIRMEEVMGVMESINSIKDDAKKKEVKEKFFKEMGKYITDNFKKDGQFTVDSFLALFQSTDWGKGGHTNELKDFFKEMTLEIVKNTGFGKDKLDKLKAKGDSAVLANYDGTEDGNPFGSRALVAYHDGTGIKFKEIEHNTASDDNKVKALDPQKIKDDLKAKLDEVKDESKFDDKQKKALADLKATDIPKILSSGNLTDLEALKNNLKALSSATGIPPAVKAHLESLLGQVEALIKTLSTKPPEAKPPEAKPPEVKPPEAKPPEAKPPEAKPPEAKPPEAKPPEAKPPEAKPPEAKPPEAKPPEAKPPEAKPPEAKPPEAKPPEDKKKADMTSVVRDVNDLVRVLTPLINDLGNDELHKFMASINRDVGDGSFDDPNKLIKLALRLEQVKPDLDKNAINAMLAVALQAKQVKDSGNNILFGIKKDIHTGPDYMYEMKVDKDNNISVGVRAGSFDGNKPKQWGEWFSANDKDINFATELRNVKNIDELRVFLQRASADGSISLTWDYTEYEPPSFDGPYISI